ncbi:exopolysaccharide biosynthesis protein [Chelativorans sp. Marseille-P2723]|uniref:exopolysaccharide biosynthesis protein n=1 Tax=Chelativorans sp. Marseille-P2723 TaxID=2709133 RepID=UPI00156F2292|nr:exopolysaccharide biosynthesis protein [Chelativorans sp. Marseille-P2723]
MTSTSARLEAAPRRLSTVLEQLAKQPDGSITVEQLRQALGDRSFATFLVFFSLFNLLPLPPGSTLVFGIPLIIISVQMTLGRQTIWLPHFLLERSISSERFRHLSEKVAPALKRLERIVRPRYWPFDRNRADRVIGMLALILATVVTLPIPFGNWFPALACALLGIALSERDGVLLLVAAIMGVLSLAIITMLVGTATVLADMLIG